MSDFLASSDLPYCKGCGHHLVVRNTIRALETMAVDPLSIILVTDIGCQGIIDRCFATHTVHGLHGRSVALGAGIAMDLPGDKQVIVFIGDGGATIGLQHLLEAARLNVDMTVVVHNNMLYGMTGGQPSSLTPCGFRTGITPEGNELRHHDLCQLIHDAGAAYAHRVVGLGDFSPTLQDAMAVEGFALVEVMELCTAHGMKYNPGLRLRELADELGYDLEVKRGNGRPAFDLPYRADTPSLLDQVEEVAVRSVSPLEKQYTLVLGGSAGEGVQRAAQITAQAALASGLQVTKKGSYPVTVGTGFSVAEIVLSPDPIHYHGISHPDAVIIVSEDGLSYNRARIREMTSGAVWLDESLPEPETGAEIHVRDFRGRAGGINAALFGVLSFSQETGIIPARTLLESMRQSKIGSKIPIEDLEQVLT